eukprot:COSAG01_NODE_15092_length_1374_cov_61.766458_2_plen_46_part_00
MSSAETDVMTEVLQYAYDAAVLALKNDCTLASFAVKMMIIVVLLV